MNINDAIDNLEEINFNEINDIELTESEIDSLQFVIRMVSNFLYEAE